MSEDAKQTKGGTWIRVTTDKNGNDHVDIYDNNPREKHDESIHITIKLMELEKYLLKVVINPEKTLILVVFLQLLVCTICKRILMITVKN